MKRRSIARALALLSSVIMLGGEALPAFAAGDDVKAAGEELAAVSEDIANPDENGEEDPDTVSGDEAVSENEAVSVNVAGEDETAEDDGELTPAEEDIVEATRPSGDPSTIASLGDNVNGSIFQQNGRVILYIDGQGTELSIDFKESAIKNYAVTDILFGGNVTTINNGAFEGLNSLQNIVFSGNIMNIGDWAFQDCAGLISISFESGKGELRIGEGAFKRCNKLNNVIIPKRVSEEMGGGTTYYGAFADCKGLITAGFEDGIAFIPDYAFEGATELQNINIPSSVTRIGKCAFEGCTSLKSITFPEKLKTIGDKAFYGNAFPVMTIPGTVTELGNWAFENCENIGTLCFAPGSGELKFGDGVFKGCKNIKSVVIPKRCAKTMGSETTYYSVFSGCTSLTDASLEQGIAYVPANAFLGATALANVTIPSSVKTIGQYAFAECPRLGSINLPSGLTKLEDRAFQYCTSLTEIRIPDKVKVIPDYCFFGCKMLEEVKLPSSIKEIQHRSFDECTRIIKVYCSKTKDKIKIGELNDHLVNAEWIKTSGKEETVTGTLTLNGQKVNSLKDAFKQMNDKEKNYTIILGSDLTGEKNLTIPKNAKSVTINGNGHVVEISGTKLTSNVLLKLENVKIRAVNKKGPAKFTINGKDDLIIGQGVSFETAGTTVKSAAGITVNGILDAKVVSCRQLSLIGVIKVKAGGSINVKERLSGYNAACRIDLEEGFKPLNIGGKVEGVVNIAGVKQVQGTPILKTSAKKISGDTLKSVFNVSGINTAAITSHLYYYKGKACIFSDAISYDGKTYGVWKDVVSDMNAAQKAAKKAGNAANFTVTLNGDTDMMGKFLLPQKGYNSITINGNEHVLKFTSDITPTGNMTITKTRLMKVDRKGKQVSGKVKKNKKYTYSGPEEF